MFEFINYAEIIVTFAVFLIALYLERGSKKKSYFLIIITGLLFLYTLFGMPLIQKNKASKNLTAYKNGTSLSCTSGFLVFSSTFSVDKKSWDLEKNYLIDKQTKESIRIDKCE